jgi:hypothetical protein
LDLATDTEEQEAGTENDREGRVDHLDHALALSAEVEEHRTSRVAPKLKVG